MSQKKTTNAKPTVTPLKTDGELLEDQVDAAIAVLDEQVSALQNRMEALKAQQALDKVRIDNLEIDRDRAINPGMDIADDAKIKRVPRDVTLNVMGQQKTVTC